MLFHYFYLSLGPGPDFPYRQTRHVHRAAVFTGVALTRKRKKMEPIWGRPQLPRFPKISENSGKKQKFGQG